MITNECTECREITLKTSGLGLENLEKRNRPRIVLVLHVHGKSCNLNK